MGGGREREEEKREKKLKVDLINAGNMSAALPKTSPFHYFMSQNEEFLTKD